MDDIIQLTEDLIVYLIETVKKERKEELERLGRELKVPSRPFKRYSYRDVVRIVMDEGYSLEETGELSPKAE